jgi:hypothetical protein
MEWLGGAGLLACGDLDEGDGTFVEPTDRLAPQGLRLIVEPG